MNLLALAGLCLVALVVIGVFILLGDANPPPACDIGQVAVHYGTGGAWACVTGTPK